MTISGRAYLLQIQGFGPMSTTRARDQTQSPTPSQAKVACGHLCTLAISVAFLRVVIPRVAVLYAVFSIT